ncbi:hypothetical protein ACLMJK_003720 [Lecanora helva]
MDTGHNPASQFLLEDFTATDRGSGRISQVQEPGEISESQEGKQVVAPDGLQSTQEDKEVCRDEAREKPIPATIFQDAANPQSSKKRRRWLFVLGVVIIVVIIAICTPVGVVETRSKDHSPSTAPSPQNNETQGVLHGTNLAVMDPFTGGDIYLFYQWSDGSIRYIDQSPERVWQGSTYLDVADAKLGTPLTSVSTNSSNGTLFSWLFYVDNANIIQNLYRGKDSSGWQKGSIGIIGHKVPNATNLAFTVSLGNAYTGPRVGLDGGLGLYATGLDDKIHEYLWSDSDGSWSEGFIFPDSDGRYGASVWSDGTILFFFAVSSSTEALTLWWRDYNSSSSENANTWHLGPSSHAKLAENSSVCGIFGVIWQDTRGALRASNFTSFDNPGQTRWDTAYDIDDVPAIDQTAISCWFFYPFQYANPNIMDQVFYQANENEITQAIRNWGLDNETVPGTWTISTVPV